MKKLVVVALFLLISNALAAEISWMYVQNRSYENGRNINRLAFGLIDEKGHHLNDGNSVVDVKLYAPDGVPVKLSKYKFDSDEEIFGLYDAIKSQWLYSDNWQRDTWFRANFSEALIPGSYRLKVVSKDGTEAESRFKFKHIVDLPIISSNTFRIYPDALGNVIWKWDIPDNLGHMVLKHATEARASIEIFKNKKNVAYFFIKIPSHMGYAFIPSQIVKKMNGKGDQFGLKIQLETSDKNTRTYSNTLVIPDMMAAVHETNTP
jgi:hypothetical protein